MHHSSTCHKIMGVIRIVLWLAMLYFGVMKILGPVEMHALVWGAAHKFSFLTFLSTEVRFWIATVGEILAGLFLVTGHWYKIGAALTLIIMAFAINAMGFGLLPVAVAVAAIAVLIWGAGAWRMCHGSCCSHDGGCCGGCKGGKCSNGSEHHQHIHQQQ